MSARSNHLYVAWLSLPNGRRFVGRTFETLESATEWQRSADGPLYEFLGATVRIEPIALRPTAEAAS